jgi:hypothetical protein
VVDNSDQVHTKARIIWQFAISAFETIAKDMKNEGEKRGIFHKSLEINKLK